jgi:hypothetical protein
MKTCPIARRRADLQKAIERFSDYGVPFLAPKEVAQQMPLYSELLSSRLGKSKK